MQEVFLSFILFNCFVFPVWNLIVSPSIHLYQYISIISYLYYNMIIGKGVFCAVDLPDTETRNKAITTMTGNDILCLTSGKTPQSPSFSPSFSLCPDSIIFLPLHIIHSRLISVWRSFCWDIRIGSRSIRVRPPLNLTEKEADIAIEKMEHAFTQLFASS